VNRTRWERLVEQLRGAEYQFGLITEASPVHRIEFAPRLTDAEIDRVENCFGFRFPPDLREFLQTALPRGPRFPDWRSGDEASLRDWLDTPRQGILFDIEHNAFWLEEWGPRPVSLDDALKVASGLIAAAPRLIPVSGHRMMPDEPHLLGNPVFSVHQTDIIYYGTDLETYLLSEFDRKVPGEMQAVVRPIRFWDLDRFQEVRWASP
jgi:hypothetical protein